MVTKSRLSFFVRNANCPLRRSNMVYYNVDGTEEKDLDCYSWIRLLEENGFDVVKTEKFKRPIVTASTLAGLKAVLLSVFFDAFRVEKSYMLLFTLKITT